MAQEWLGLVESKSLMGNVYLDLPGVAGAFTPFVGLGMGIGRTNADYASVWSRNTDPVAIDTGRDQPNADQIARNLSRHVQLGAGYHGGYTDQLPNSRWIRLPGVGNGVGRTQGSLDEVG